MGEQTGDDGRKDCEIHEICEISHHMITFFKTNSAFNGLKIKPFQQTLGSVVSRFFNRLPCSVGQLSPSKIEHFTNESRLP